MQIDYADVDAQRQEPFQLFDDLYYVGVKRVSAHLIKTSDGLILIDTTMDHLAYQVLQNIRKLGFEPREIKYIVISHWHSDHAGGAKRIQEATGAQVAIGAGDAAILAKGVPVKKDNGSFPVPPVTPDLELKDGDKITLGSTTLTCYSTPGHTLGTTSVEWIVHDHGTPRKALFFGGPGVNAQDLKAFMESVQRLQQIKDVEVMVPTHPFLNDEFVKAEHSAARKPDEPNPFVSPDEHGAFLARLLERAKAKLKQ